MDFNLSPEAEDLRVRVRAFVERHVLPLEADPDAYDAGENLAAHHLNPLRERARAEGLWALQMPRSRGGQGLDKVGMAACYEEMNRSIFDTPPARDGFAVQSRPPVQRLTVEDFNLVRRCARLNTQASRRDEPHSQARSHVERSPWRGQQTMYPAGVSYAVSPT